MYVLCFYYLLRETLALGLIKCLKNVTSCVGFREKIKSVIFYCGSWLESVLVDRWQDRTWLPPHNGSFLRRFCRDAGGFCVLLSSRNTTSDDVIDLLSAHDTHIRHDSSQVVGLLVVMICWTGWRLEHPQTYCLEDNREICSCFDKCQDERGRLFSCIVLPWFVI